MIKSESESGVSSSSQSLRERVARCWAEIVLAVIIISSTSLSLFWVFTVPIFQNPDETSHIDYVFSIYSAGRLLNVRTPPSDWNVHARFEGRVGPEGAPYEFMSHQYTLYLIEATDFQRIRFHAQEKVTGDYGTRDYFRKIDLNAPPQPAKLADLAPQDNPWLVTGYPFGYYALVAIWLKVLSLFSSGPAFLFLGARILSVILLAGSLILTYATLRELRLSKARALTLTTIMAFFPLVTFLSSAVQPDNLTLFLVLFCSYCALRLRREWARPRLLALLGIALGALIATKYHVFLITAITVCGLVVVEHIFRRQSAIKLARTLAILFLPAVLFFAVQLWVVGGGGKITGSNLHRGTTGKVEGVKRAVENYYRGGQAFESWWGAFGWMDTPLVIRSPQIQRRVLQLCSALTLLSLVLLAFRLEQVTTRLIVLAWRGRWRRALRIAFSNPLINGHFIYSVFMIGLFALTDNAFNAQGRHWFPYVVSSLLVTTQFAPRALSHRRTQAALSGLLVAGLLLYSAVGSYYSVKTIRDRFYVTQQQTP